MKQMRIEVKDVNDGCSIEGDVAIPDEMSTDTAIALLKKEWKRICYWMEYEIILIHCIEDSEKIYWIPGWKLPSNNISNNDDYLVI